MAEVLLLGDESVFAAGTFKIFRMFEVVFFKVEIKVIIMVISMRN